MSCYPLLFEPVYKDYIWGGHRIPEIYDRNTDQEICAESWEIADRPEGMSVVKNGSLAGKTLEELVKSMGRGLLGTSCRTNGFPLLIKIIDAKKRLSVQVHPNDETAARYGGEAKTECWYILGDNSDACVFAGLEPGTNAETFRTALEAEELEKMLCRIPAREGETIYIPGGRVHAIAEECLLLEVQQNSNTTYRVYDWGRVGHDGKPRELHVEQAFQVINWSDTAPEPICPTPTDKDGDNTWFDIIKSPYFHLTRLDMSVPERLINDGSSFRILFTLNGIMEIKGNEITEELSPGTSCLLPAGLEECTISPADGNSSVISITH